MTVKHDAVDLENTVVVVVGHKSMGVEPVELKGVSMRAPDLEEVSVEAVVVKKLSCGSSHRSR